MFVSVKNQKNFDASGMNAVSSYLISKAFKEQYKQDYHARLDESLRYLIRYSHDLFIIPHTEAAFVEELPTEIHLISHEEYGHFEFYKLATDANKDSILYWAVRVKSKYIVASQLGVIAKNAIDASSQKPTMLARFDKLWIGNNRSSSVLAIDAGSSHSVT